MIDAENILNDFEKYQRVLHMADTTIEWERNLLSWFLKYLEEQDIELLTDVDTRTMLRYQIYVSELKNNKNEAYNPRTQNMAISVVRKTFKMLRRQGAVFVNPTEVMESAKLPQTLPRNILSVKEMKKVLSLDSSFRNKAIMEVLYSSGMRSSELRNLDLNDLNPDEKTIFIRLGKGSKDRVVPCGLMAWKCLQRYLKNERPNLIDDLNEQAVFLNKEGGRFSKQGLLLLVKNHVRNAGIKKDISPVSYTHLTLPTNREV